MNEGPVKDGSGDVPVPEKRLRRAWSLRRRLIYWIGAAAVALWLGTSVWTYLVVMAETDRTFDAALVNNAQTLLALLHNEAAELVEEPTKKTEREFGELAFTDPKDIVFQIRGANGGLVLRSQGAPASMMAGWSDRGLQTRTIDGVAYRVCTLADELDAVTVHVAQPLEKRTAVARASALRLLLPGLVLVFLLALAVVWNVRRLFVPVTVYAAELDRLVPDEAASADGGDLPTELRPVAGGVDRLVRRLRQALIRERTLTADAAHELRNPLGALRLQAQVLERIEDPEHRKAGLRTLQDGVDRMTRLIESMLTLARLDGAVLHPAGSQSVDLLAIAHLVRSEFEVLQATRQIALELEELGPAQVRGDEDALAVALRNLVNNALRFARSRVRIEVGPVPHGTVLRVLDDGPGFNAESAQRAFDRFYRGTESGRAVHGAGLGLAMVQQIAKMHGARAGIVPGLGGSGGGVEIVFPDPA